MGTVTKHLGIPCDRTFETNLFAAEADPKKVRSARVLGKRFDVRKLESQGYNAEPEGGKPSALYQNPGTIRLFEKRFFRIRGYLRYIEPDGGKPSALYIKVRAQ